MRDELEGDALMRDAWDVASWVFGPPQPYRLNSLFRAEDGAVVTATGRFEQPAAAADLSALLRPFEVLGTRVVVDVYHAVLGDLVVRALVNVGLRGQRTSTSFTLAVAHAKPLTRHQLASAGGAGLLQP